MMITWSWREIHDTKFIYSIYTNVIIKDIYEIAIMTAHKTRKNANVEKSKSKLCTIYTIYYDTCRQTDGYKINSWRQSKGHPLQETVATTSVVLVN